MTNLVRFPLVLTMIAAFSAVASAQLKVATLNMEKALLETAEMKKEQADMEARFKKPQSDITKLQGELAEMQKQLQTMGDKLKPEVQQQMVADGQRKEKQLQRMTEDLQADVDRDRQEILERGRKNIEPIVNKVAEEKGLDMVIDASTAFYSKPTLDISKDVTAAYDKAHPVAPAAAAAK